MTEKKPVSPSDLEDADSPPASALDYVERVADDLRRSKGELLSDEEVMGELLRQTVDGPSTFPSEGGGGMARLIRSHSLKGRTNKIKVFLWLSDNEMAQMTTYKDVRGDRTMNDMINELVCRALAALRSI